MSIAQLVTAEYSMKKSQFLDAVLECVPTFYMHLDKKLSPRRILKYHELCPGFFEHS
jgi:hypothetical protein